MRKVRTLPSYEELLKRPENGGYRYAYGQGYQRGRRDERILAVKCFIAGIVALVIVITLASCTPPPPDPPQIATEPHDAHVLTEHRHLLAVEGVTIPQSQTWDDFLRSLDTIKMSLFFQKREMLPPYNRGFGVVTEAGVLRARIATTEPYGGTETKITRCLFFFGSDAIDIKAVTVDYDSSLVIVWSYLDIYKYWGRW